MDKMTAFMRKHWIVVAGVVAALIVVGLIVAAMFGHGDTQAPGRIDNTPVASKTMLDGAQDTDSTGAPDQVMGDDETADRASPDGPDSDIGAGALVVDQPRMSMDAANKHIQDCFNSATEDQATADGVRKLANRCFFSMTRRLDYVYGLRTVGEVDKVETRYYHDDGSGPSKYDVKNAYAVSTFYIGGKRAGSVVCFWDVALTQCKLQKIAINDYFIPLMDENVMTLSRSGMKSED